VSLFGGGGAKKALAALRSAFPDLDVDAEVQKRSFGKVLCVVVRGRTGSEAEGLPIDEARELAPRVWRTAKDNADVPFVLSSVIDTSGGEWLVAEDGRLETY